MSTSLVYRSKQIYVHARECAGYFWISRNQVLSLKVRFRRLSAHNAHTDIIAAAITVKRGACRNNLLYTSNATLSRRQCFLRAAAAQESGGDFLLISVFRSYCTVQTYTKGDARTGSLAGDDKETLLNASVILTRLCTNYVYIYPTARCVCVRVLIII
jgi:hypothetical protein